MEPEAWADWKLLEFLHEELDGRHDGLESMQARDAVRDLVSRFEQMQRAVSATLEWFAEARDSGRKVEARLSEWRT